MAGVVIVQLVFCERIVKLIKRIVALKMDFEV